MAEPGSSRCCLPLFQVVLKKRQVQETVTVQELHGACRKGGAEDLGATSGTSSARLPSPCRSGVGRSSAPLTVISSHSQSFRFPTTHFRDLNVSLVSFPVSNMSQAFLGARTYLSSWVVSGIRLFGHLPLVLVTVVALHVASGPWGHWGGGEIQCRALSESLQQQ